MNQQIEVIERPEIFDKFNELKDTHLDRGDTIFLNDGRQVTIIRMMDRENWRFLVQELAPSDFDIVEYLNR